MTPNNSYIEVAVALPVYNTFTYSVPKTHTAFISVGKRVLVPFGRRRVTGYILGPGKNARQKEIKPILDMLDEKPLFPSSMIKFFKWIADYYKYPIGEVIKSALPGGLTLYDFASIAITEEGKSALSQGTVTPIVKEILTLLESGPCRLKNLNKKINKTIPGALIHALQRRGQISKTREFRKTGTKSKLERHIALADSILHLDRLSKPKKKIIDILKSNGEIPITKLRKQVPTAPNLIGSLENKGYITIRYKRVYRDPFGEPIKSDAAPVLTQDQQKVVAQVTDGLDKGFTTFLLQGVTGSGKTEVYMQVAAEAIGKGQSALVLVPEIALITQMERRFRARFGERIAVLHSGLSTGERYDQWSRILQKEAAIAIGARSAIFAPFARLGLIIVDEEHDTSYKQESSLRYHARDLAVVRAKLNNCVVLLGSATPSIQSYYNVTANKFIELNLKQRIKKRPLPEIKIVDLRQNRGYRGMRRFITSELHQAMKERIARGEQVLLFLNRRGYASFAVCGTCGQPLRCKHCDISLTLHKRADAYKCHYCGFTRATTSSCDACGSKKFKKLGLGTEKIEAAIKGLFPDARVARMDRDTTTQKGSIVKLLKGLKDKSIDILVGTQMVAKGHDFPNITLVGIICADLSLSFPDFRAGERTFQLLAQVSGRAGRGASPGRVILQTYNPDDFSILAARDQDFDAFYRQEIGFRKALNYPPFSRMIQLKISGKDIEKTKAHARRLGVLCSKLKSTDQSTYRTLEIMGPIEAALSKIAERHRWQILLKSLNAKALHHFVGRLLVENPASFNNRNVRVVIDVDPFFMM